MKKRPNMQSPQFSRRRFLQGSGASLLSAASIGGVLNSLNSFNSYAATDGEYKALVCVFLLGGMDNHDLILPYDNPSWEQYNNIRSTLLNEHGENRSFANLLALDPLNQVDFGGRQFALPPQMSNLNTLFKQGNAAIVGNVGPLIEPTSRLQYINNSVRLPARLFSHNDQQSTWQASSPEGAQYGWGGLFADAAILASPQASNEFSTISSTGNSLFLTGQYAQPYQVSTKGAANIELLQQLQNASDNSVEENLINQLQLHFQGGNFSGQSIISADVAALLSKSYASNTTFNATNADEVVFNTSFPDNSLGQQLKVVAQTISKRQTLQINRQVFFVGIGGFDTHSDQAKTLPALHSQIDTSIGAFYRTLEEIGLSQQVTLFTASDFGRTLAVNGDGTDHGWGAHHFVVGGAVNGNQIYGKIPPPSFEHDADAGNGRLIPSVSVEQFAAPMGRWFGLSDDQLITALPNLVNFPQALLNFV